MKRGPLTKEDKKYLDKNKHKPVEHLAKRLNRTVDAVNKYLNPEVKETGVQEVVQEQKPTMLNNFARKPERGVVVMTKNASELLDAKRESRKPKLDPSYIHRFRPTND